ncbi:MAG: hypothetical protein LC798_19840 [Chloroflexi bacterium]|nr:hypothetical protein [Chloroflexota bacterium]
MSGGKFSMDEYVPVAERVDAFKSAFPDGSLQSEIVELTAGRVTVRAMAYRTPDDPRPGVGHSSLEIPGSTAFTRGSEIENAETSAWGRAIAALGFEVKRGIASAEEARNKQPDQRGARASSPSAAPAPKRDQYRRDDLLIAAKKHGLDRDALERYAVIIGIDANKGATHEQMDALIEAVDGHGTSAVIDTSQSEGPESSDATTVQPDSGSPSGSAAPAPI